MRLAVAISALILLAEPAVAEPAIDDVDYLLAECSLSSNEDLCKTNSDQFRADFKKAFKKDYQAQRNVAFCLIDGCNGAVVKNKPLGCAWRLVILASGSTRIDDTDKSNYDWVCRGHLDPSDSIIFQGQAQELFKRIYKKTLQFP